MIPQETSQVIIELRIHGFSGASERKLKIALS